MPSRLTLPSRGRPQAGFAHLRSPLMSNVRAHEDHMPNVLIEVRNRYTPEQEVALMEAVHLALCETFGVAKGARCERLIAHESHRFSCPVSKEKPEFYTCITVEAFAGRSLEAKRSLYKAIVANLLPFGIPPDHVSIVLIEVPRENWGIRGGQAACDLESEPTLQSSPPHAP